jgi:hypothetical protein
MAYARALTFIIIIVGQRAAGYLLALLAMRR